MHPRIRAGTRVSWVDQEVVIIIADQVLLGMSLRREWKQGVEKTDAADEGFEMLRAVLDPETFTVLPETMTFVCYSEGRRGIGAG